MESIQVLVKVNLALKIFTADFFDQKISLGQEGSYVLKYFQQTWEKNFTNQVFCTYSYNAQPVLIFIKSCSKNPHYQKKGRKGISTHSIDFSSFGAPRCIWFQKHITFKAFVIPEPNTRITSREIHKPKINISIPLLQNQPQFTQHVSREQSDLQVSHITF